MPSVTKIIGFICRTIAFCDKIYPPAQVPPVDILPDTFGSISRQFSFDNQPSKSDFPIATITKQWGPSSQVFNDDTFAENVQIKGKFSRTVHGRPFSAFEGIPYAKPPVGNRRFKDPQKYTDWDETFDATKKSPVCIQMDVLRFYNVIGEEDCLYLNIYTPRRQSGNRGDNKLYPTMVFFHGGSFMLGSGNYYGANYFLDKDIVLITVNYRLGPLGFLSTGDDRLPGNIGLKDQAMAINWVYYNIQAFGGDPEKITVFGQSAGAASTHLQMMSSYAKDKINSAILHSGSAFSIWALPLDMANLTSRFVSIFGCSPQSSDLVNCLRRIPAKTLTSRQYDLFEWREFPIILFGPVIEHKHPNAFISETPEFMYKTGQVANIPIITGVTKDEGNLLSIILYAGLGGRSLLRNLNKAIPAILQYRRNDWETTEKVKQYYFGSFGKPSLSGYEALESAGQMLGDLFFYTAGEKAIEFHTNWTSSPVYAYFFSYQGKHGLSEKFNIPAKQFGVVHADDMQFLFNNTEYFYPLSPKENDYTIVEYMTTLFGNFATNRVPSLKNVKRGKLSNGLNSPSEDIWTKYDVRERNVLNINQDLFMITEPYKKRFDFWKSTPYFKKN